jgi:hypothetical protein
MIEQCSQGYLASTWLSQALISNHSAIVHLSRLCLLCNKTLSELL